jgi:hypothetical protein
VCICVCVCVRVYVCMCVCVCVCVCVCSLWQTRTERTLALFHSSRPAAQGIVDGATFTRNLNEFIERFDKESYWVQAEVLTQQSAKVTSLVFAG